MPNAYYLIYQIGPVQEFIESARKSRDLWFGSWLLSDLSKFLASQINTKYPGSLVFPILPVDIQQGVLSSPNKIVAVLPEEIDKEFLDGLQPLLVNHLKNNYWDELTKAPSKILLNIDTQLADAQILDLIEAYYVFVPFDEGSPNGYFEARSLAERWMAARKSFRNYGNLVGKAVPKSSLDGARESVINEALYPSSADSKNNVALKSTNLQNYFRAKRGERLSAIDILKRLGASNKAPTYPSTSDIAARSIFTDNRGLQNYIREICIAFGLDVEAVNNSENKQGLVFESRLKEILPGQVMTPEQRVSYKNILNEQGIKEPSPYYAILRADGDNMGAVLDQLNGADSKTKHQQLSRVLIEFSLSARAIVEGENGVLIYSGGDDVLAYLPVGNALSCAKKLSEGYSTSILQGLQIQATLSVGIAVIHHLEPLSDALKLSHEAEVKYAKKVTGKNGFGLILSKRSGVDRVVVGKMDTLPNRLETLIGFIQQDGVSAGLAYELQHLVDVHGQTGQSWITSEALRIIKRKRVSGGQKAISRQVLSTFTVWLDPSNYPQNNPAELVRDLSNQLIVAKFMAKP